METKIIHIGSSLGAIIPKSFALNEGLQAGTRINISNTQGTIIIKKVNKRNNWSKMFKKYAELGQEEMLLPDSLDTETDDLL